MHDDDGREGAAALGPEKISRDRAVGGVGLALGDERDAHGVEAALVGSGACRTPAGAGENGRGNDDDERQGPCHAVLLRHAGMIGYSLSR